MPAWNFKLSPYIKIVIYTFAYFIIYHNNFICAQDHIQAQNTDQKVVQETEHHMQQEEGEYLSADEAIVQLPHKADQVQEDDFEFEDALEDEIDEYEDESDEEYTSTSSELERTYAAPRIINSIIVEGNNYVNTQAILNKIPYQVGELFKSHKSNALIRNLFEMNSFRNIQLFARNVGTDKVDLRIVVTEKTPLKEVTFVGNKHLSEAEITKKLNFKDIAAVDEDELKRFVVILKKLYREKNFHNVEITPTFVKEHDKAIITFTIKEHHQSLVKRVFFVGNDNFPSKTLRSLLFTREDWVFGFMDKSGTYHPDALESDKHTIENFYQSNGYMNAKVTLVEMQPDPNGKNFYITFFIEEGDIYTINEVQAPGNDELSEELLLANIPIKRGDLYSREKIRQTIELLRLLWGEFGYIYAEIEPSIEPDDSTKTVSLAFFSELGPKIFLNRIMIKGNQKTRDKVIRRQLVLEDGGLLTTKKMDDSKNRVALLGYFDQQNGVNWKMTRVGKDRADLDLIVKEIKTGRVDGTLGFGGSPKDLSNPTESLRIGASFSDLNFLGFGVACSASGAFSKQEQELMVNVTQPWLFDRPIYSSFDFGIKRSIYDQFKLLKENLEERTLGGTASLGFFSHSLYETRLVGQAGGQRIMFKNKATIREERLSEIALAPYQKIVNERFTNGTLAWLMGSASQDFRNHPMHPYHGYQWLATAKLSFPVDTFGFMKLDMDGSYYTPLIGERDLVLALHGHIGCVTQIAHKSIPYRELYNIGGPASVRGFTFGELSPSFSGETIGARKALWVNAELIFPISPDFSMKGAFFYDGGSGWDTLGSSELSTGEAKELLRNNGFNYRHAVGIGVRVYRPTPIKIDWGFKLDRRKGESESEVHFTMSQEF